MKTKSSEKRPDYIKKMANAKGIPWCKSLRKKARKILNSEAVESPEPEEKPMTKEEKYGLKKLLADLNKNQEAEKEVHKPSQKRQFIEKMESIDV